MSTNDFARPAWVVDVLTKAHGQALPQFTTRTFQSLSVNTPTERLMQHYTSAQTEHSRLRFMLDRLEAKMKLLSKYAGRIPADKLPEIDKMLDDEERSELEEVEDYEEEVWSERAKIGVWEGVRELHRSIESLKERIREVERDVKKAEKGEKGRG
ncbi:hypothetical protein G7Y79_00008g025180 [Physcia stellaris]|nr:hypothetical protein G7Y79_00008g025180 [Physcia stellaris]